MRPIHAIARAIIHDWKSPYFGAVPYLSAMRSLNTVKDDYGADSGQSVVLYFLSNANTYRTPVAKLYKAELKEHAGLKLSKQERTLIATSREMACA
jgi:hypothetical protein